MDRKHPPILARLRPRRPAWDVMFYNWVFVLLVATFWGAVLALVLGKIGVFE